VLLTSAGHALHSALRSAAFMHRGTRYPALTTWPQPFRRRREISDAQRPRVRRLRLIGVGDRIASGFRPAVPPHSLLNRSVGRAKLHARTSRLRRSFSRWGNAPAVSERCRHAARIRSATCARPVSFETTKSSQNNNISAQRCAIILRRSTVRSAATTGIVAVPTGPMEDGNARSKTRRNPCSVTPRYSLRGPFRQYNIVLASPRNGDRGTKCRRGQ
jgi:hypothetical protein